MLDRLRNMLIRRLSRFPQIDTLVIEGSDGRVEISRRMAVKFTYARSWGREMLKIAGEHQYTKWQCVLDFGKNFIALPYRNTPEEASDDVRACVSALKEFAAGGNPVVVIRENGSTTFQIKAA